MVLSDHPHNPFFMLWRNTKPSNKVQAPSFLTSHAIFKTPSEMLHLFPPQGQQIRMQQMQLRILYNGPLKIGHYGIAYIGFVSVAISEKNHPP